MDEVNIYITEVAGGGGGGGGDSQQITTKKINKCSDLERALVVYHRYKVLAVGERRAK